MSANQYDNFLYNFLLKPQFKISRHALFITTLLFVALGQSFFVFRNDIDVLGNKVYWFGVILVIIYIAFAYFNLYYLAHKFLLKEEYATYFLILLASTGTFLIVKFATEYFIFLSHGIKKEINGVLVLEIISNLTLNSICIASSSVTVLFKQWIVDTEEINNLENKRLKNSIEDIKNHINPKFLFNTIDQASIIVKNNPEKTSAILFELSELLRYELYDCKRQKVVLKSDISFINSYLLLEQQNPLRDFQYSISSSGNTNLFVYPFVFIPFVQQIMEHHPKKISLNFVVNDTIISFTVSTSNINLTNCNFSEIEKRLQILYNEDFSIEKIKESIKIEVKTC